VVFAGPTLIALTLGVMASWTWGKWPDAVVDFGRELYIPWQLLGGKTLYTDLAYFNGPLSPYVNALWFGLFGVSLRTLVLCNLAITVGVLCLLYRLLSEVAGRFSATTACAMFLMLFAFGELAHIGNYNFICPYSHELTHGISLTLAALVVLSRYLRRRTLGAVAATGALVGLVFLTKAEVFLAALLALASGIGASLYLERPSPRRVIAVSGIFLGSMTIAPLLAVLLLASRMPLEQAVHGTLGTWPYVVRAELVAAPFYRMWMGTLDLGSSVKSMGRWLGTYALIFGPPALMSCVPLKGRRLSSVLSAGLMGSLGFLLIQGLIQGLDTRTMLYAAQPLPVILLLAGGVSFARLPRQRQTGDTDTSCIMRLALIVLALGLLGKMILLARIYNNGFVLAMPATMVFILLLLDWVPAAIARAGGAAGSFRAWSLTVLLVLTVFYVESSAHQFSKKRHPIGRGADAFYADEKGPVVQEMLAELERWIPPAKTLAALPYGVMLNYLARRDNPTPYITCDPFELLVHGERRVLAAYQQHPPDYLVLVHYDTLEFGARFFGRDYARQLFSWIREEYATIRVIGARPFEGDRFGMELLRRIPR
jgi:hypothetical protein